MKTEHPKLNWKPRRCTHAAYRAARKLGKALAKTCGKGYTINVWENSGWHHSAISPCGRIKVHGGSGLFAKCHIYTAFLGQPARAGGTWAESGRTPKAAIRKVVAVAKSELAKIGAVIHGL